MNSERGPGATFLVEHYRPDMTVEGFERAARRMRDVADSMPQIRILHFTLVPGDDSAFCVLGAPSVALVEEAHTRAGIAFARIVDALELGDDRTKIAEGEAC